MLQSLSLPTLSQQRDIAKVIFLYKILHQVVDVSVPDCYLTPVLWNTRGHPSKFIQLRDEPILLFFSPIFLSGNSFIFNLFFLTFCLKFMFCSMVTNMFVVRYCSLHTYK